MNRRNLLIIGASVAITWPRGVRAQQKAMPVIGYLWPASAESAEQNLAAFRQGLGESGYVEGRNVAIVYRMANGNYDSLARLAADLVDRKVDVIVALSVTTAIAAKAATTTIPVVFAGGDDPVAAGVIASLGHPGGNLTGVSFLLVELHPKRLELLIELMPRAKVVALLLNPKNSQMERVISQMQQAAGIKGIYVPVLKAATESEIGAAFVRLPELQADALVISSDPFFASRSEQLVTLAEHHAVPTIYQFPEVVRIGGLIAYGPSILAVNHEVGIYAGKILKGAKPADLPVQQPTNFELVINLKTAKALGLTVPQSLLQRADEVIE